MNLAQQAKAQAAASRNLVRASVTAAARKQPFDAGATLAACKVVSLSPKAFDELVRLQAELDGIEQQLQGVDLDALREQATESSATFWSAVQAYRNRGILDAVQMNDFGFVAKVRYPDLEESLVAMQETTQAFERADRAQKRADKLSETLANLGVEPPKQRAQMQIKDPGADRHAGDGTRGRITWDMNGRARVQRVSDETEPLRHTEHRDAERDGIVVRRNLLK